MSEIQDFSSLFTLKGKTAVITGGSRGLGLHAATGLLLAGCTTIIITSRKADACESAVKSLQALKPTAKISAIPADLSKPSEVERFVKEIAVITDGKIDILIANAGASWGAPFDTHPDSAFVKVMDLNVRSVFNLIRCSAPLLEKAAAERGGDERSRIVTVGSVGGIAIGGIGIHGAYGYTASKAAVMHMTKHLAIELAPRKILVNSIAPGFFPSKMANGVIDLLGGVDEAGKDNPTGRLGRPEDIVGAVVYLCSNGASHINGAILPIDGGKHLAQSKL